MRIRTRAAKAGVRVFVAVGIGKVFVLCQQLVESGAMISSLPPAVLAWLPTAALAVVGSILVLRVR
jgi:lipopolysaccharide export LptBFGC system permease protein LptF